MAYFTRKIKDIKKMETKKYGFICSADSIILIKFRIDIQYEPIIQNPKYNTIKCIAAEELIPAAKFVKKKIKIIKIKLHDIINYIFILLVPEINIQ